MFLLSSALKCLETLKTSQARTKKSSVSFTCAEGPDLSLLPTEFYTILTDDKPTETTPGCHQKVELLKRFLKTYFRFLCFLAMDQETLDRPGVVHRLNVLSIVAFF